MSKPQLQPPLDQLEGDIIDTLIAGLKEWRPDLDYPASHSDMSACVRGLLKMYELKRRPIGLASLPLHCENCSNKGEIKTYPEPGRQDIIKMERCNRCNRR